MKTLPRRVALPLLVALAIGPSIAGQEIPIPIEGRPFDVSLNSGDRIRGELIAADAGVLTLLEGTDLRTVPLGDVARVRAQRHGLDGRKVLLWVGVGSLAVGLGMSFACSQVDNQSCGSVFASTTAGFGILGGLLGWGVASTSWRDLPVYEDELRAFARFPQGLPPGFRGGEGARGPARR